MIMTSEHYVRWNPTKRVWAVVQSRGYCVAEVVGCSGKSFALQIARTFNQKGSL
jgi:hypothetical protein